MNSLAQTGKYSPDMEEDATVGEGMYEKGYKY